MTPQLLILGHIVKDRHQDGWRPGGGALYAAAQAAKLVSDAAVVTACERDIEPPKLVPDAQWHVKALDQSIQFENTYTRGRRSQRLLSTAQPLTLADIPEEWRDAPQVLLAPMFHDIDPGLPGQLVKQGTRVAIAAQGWLRALDGDRVVPASIEEAPEWLHAETVFLSEEDVLDPDALEVWRGRVATIVLTRGSRGYTIWDAGGRHDLDVTPAREVDPTGAGDVFATAWLVRFGETRDALEAAAFAAAAASLAVEGIGIESVGDRGQIEGRMGLAGVRS